MTAFNHQVLPWQRQLRHYAGQNIKVAKSLQWRRWLLGTLFLCHAEIVGRLEGGGGVSTEKMEDPSCGAEGGVGGTVSDDGWWLASVDLRARGQLRSGLADGLAVCLGLCSL